MNRVAVITGDIHHPPDFVKRQRRVYKLLLVAHLHEVDNPLILPEALTYMSSYLRKMIYVLIRGEGPLGTQMVRKLKALNVKFKLIPRVAFKFMPRMYREADIYVHTSHLEGFGFPVVEAMASGIPVIVPSNSAPEEIAQGAALVYQKADAYDLADKITVLLSDAELYDRVAQACHKRSLVFDWRHTIKEYMGVYTRVLGEL